MCFLPLFAPARHFNVCFACPRFGAIDFNLFLKVHPKLSQTTSPQKTVCWTYDFRPLLHTGRGGMNCHIAVVKIGWGGRKATTWEASVFNIFFLWRAIDTLFPRWGLGITSPCEPISDFHVKSLCGKEINLFLTLTILIDRKLSFCITQLKCFFPVIASIVGLVHSVKVIAALFIVSSVLII